ncbi:MAG: helix-turn-helix domain-containing protein [Streptosporangiaceae bacterium]|nr:helix-turn-helix domain-containing protein [Streptosporangiaceae bacterium]MBV9858466.1 helix-turn-helix domain-containing protein [Streptosporangiaceae bacterium]
MTVTADRGNRRLRELGDLLRSRRARLQPADAGLPRGRRRRTPGLRREEVAQLAGVSPTYYAFLEQGRNIRPSPEVLDALARALQMGPAERAHLRALAHGPAPEDDSPAEVLAPGVDALVERLDPCPTFVKGRRWDILAANRSARALFADWLELPRSERNELWWMFTDPRAREVYADWPQDAAAMLARFRDAAARRPDDPEFLELIERLHERSAEVRAWWPRHEVLAPGSGIKHLRHPLLGDLSLQHVVLQIADHPDQKLVTFAAGQHERDLARLAATVPAGDTLARGRQTGKAAGGRYHRGRDDP